MKKVLIQSSQVTIFVFGMVWAVSLVSDLKLFSAFDTIGQALKDTELTDYAFNQLRPDPTVDERIVLVNIGTLSRREVAREIQMISQFKHRVIGRSEGHCKSLDTLGKLMIINAIQESSIAKTATFCFKP
jgi:hypothetical protein